MNTEIQVIVAIGLLSAYFFFLLLMRHSVREHFLITRLTVSAFVVFMFVTLTIVYWSYLMENAVIASLSFLAGLALGRLLAVSVERQRIAKEGLPNYVEHYLHVHIKSLDNIEIWSVINVHTVIASLIFVNLLGLNRTVFESSEMTTFVIAVGIFLVGTMTPYTIHLWTIKASHSHKKLSKKNPR